jgi:hypothetical protein
MTKSDYLKRVKPTITILIDGQPLAGNVKEFSTGSLGYNANGKVTIPLQDGDSLKYQVSMNITAIGSKEWEKESVKS